MRCWFVGLFLLTWATIVWADEPTDRAGCWRPGWLMQRVCPSIGCCPDDYCRKPCPLIDPLPHCGGPDDYCRKTMPCLFDFARLGLCDDYCRKPLPSLLCPPWSPYLRCAPCPAPR